MESCLHSDSAVAYDACAPSPSPARSWNCPFSRNSSALWCAWKKSRLVVSSALSPVIVSPSISKHALLCSRSFENASCTSMWPCCLASTATAVSPMPLLPRRRRELVDAPGAVAQTELVQLVPAVVQRAAGGSRSRLFPAPATMLYMYPRHVSTSFHHGTGSQRLGVRRRHVSITSWMSVRLCPGFWCCGRCALDSSTNTRVLSCSSTNTWKLCRLGTCAAAPSSGSFHQRSNSSFTACLQHCSASATRPLSSAVVDAHRRRARAVSSTSDVARGRRGGGLWTRVPVVHGARTQCSMQLGVVHRAREKSETSSHWFSCFALIRASWSPTGTAPSWSRPETCPALARLHAAEKDVLRLLPVPVLREREPRRG